MKKPRINAGLAFITTLFCLWCAFQPVSAQINQSGGEDKPEPLIRVIISDLQVQGQQTPEAVRDAINNVLPQMVSCIEAEYERVKKLPNKLMLRFNLGSNGKIGWSQLIDPPLKSLDACLSKTLKQVQMPPAGNTVTRVTMLLEIRMDHLLVQ